MGRQVEFYMDYQDELEFVAAARQRGPVKLIYNTFFKRDAMELASLEPVEELPGTNPYVVFLSLGRNQRSDFYF